MKLHHALAALSLGLGAGLAGAQPLAVTVENHSSPTQCAEEDNVSLSLKGYGVTRFAVEALQPKYLPSIASDTTAPDFTGCNFDGSDHPTDPRFRFTPRTRVLHDGATWRIVGITLPTFWRSQRVPVTLAGVTTRDIHLLQLFKQVRGRPVEVVVLYPSDGYWRIKPLPQARFGDGAYGTSMLIGPVEAAQRPVVDIRSIAITTQPLSLRLTFAGGSSARIKIREVSRERTALDVSFRPAVDDNHPFAVVRSMYVAADNADMSEVGWRSTSNATMKMAPLPEVSSLTAIEVRFGRGTPSRHNTSAPDLRFSAFR